MQEIIEKAADESLDMFGAWKLSAVDPLEIAHAALLFPDEAQVAVFDAFRQGGDVPALAMLGEMINLRFNENYAAAAKALTLSGTDAPAGENVVVWVMYDYHICICLIRADGTWECTLFMSDRTVLAGFSEDYISQLLGQLTGPMPITILK